MSGTSRFDDLLTHLGTGPWNMLYFLASSYWLLLVPPQFLSGVYVAPAINYTCLPPEGTRVDSCSYTRVTEAGAEVEEACTEWDFDTSVFTSTLTSEFSLVCDKKKLQATFQSIYMLGTFFCPLIGGYIADRFGRKVVVVVTQIVVTLFSIIIIFFNNFIIILALRFLLGSSNMLTFFIYAMEVCEPKHRGTVGILIGLPWALSTMAFGGVAYFIRDWRWLQLAVSLPNVLIFPALYFMDESPRWLIVRGRHDQAMRVLRKAARWNRVKLQPEADLRALMKEIQEESSTCSSVPGNTDINTKKFRLTLPNLLSTRAIQVITAVICIDYFVVSFVFDGLNYSGDIYSADPFLYIILNGLVEVPGYSVTAPIVDRWGRKMPTVVSYILSGVVIFVIAFIPPDLPALILTLALAGKVCISGAYQIIYLYSSELFPTEVRMQGIGAASVFAQLASTVVPFVTSVLGSVLPWLPSLIFGIAAAAAGALTVTLRETNGMPLPDTIADLSAPAKAENDTKKCQEPLMSHHTTDRSEESSCQKEEDNSPPSLA
ncbi:organic cation transporter protein-like [Portunus trituberculatus]|uniref:organic cation transporter protein-like n=1 Tax=Portunus trituberculatus TaxID=210409 RepID=UPI001E1CC4AB|nr:organic cation transporter protein-like [Portunus trituberculatus]